MRSVFTNELVSEIKNNTGKMFEVAIVKHGFRATHFIYFGGKLLYDTGIDSKEVMWKPNDFIDYYRNKSTSPKKSIR